jgi:hypothetical protein
MAQTGTGKKKEERRLNYRCNLDCYRVSAMRVEIVMEIDHE